MNDELIRLEKKALRKDPVMPRDLNAENKKALALENIERIRKEVLDAIAKQAELKAGMEAAMSHAQHQIDYTKRKLRPNRPS